MDERERRLAAEAFHYAEDVAASVRGKGKTTIKGNGRFAVLLTCPCGRPTLRDGQVEYPIDGGVCEGCGRPLAHVTVITRAHAAQLDHLRPTIASQRRAYSKAPELADVLAIPGVDPDGPPEALLALGSERLAKALTSVLQERTGLLEEIVNRALAEPVDQAE